MNTWEVSKKRKAKLTLLAIVAISALPIAAAYISFFTGVGIPVSTVNKGVILDPVLAVKTLLDEEQWQRFEDDKKWRILLPLSETCNQKCQNNFYVTRQVHVRLGEKGTRLERLVLNFGGDANAEFLEGLKSSHPLLRRIDVEPTLWRRWSETLAQYKRETESHFYLLVDQEGHAMMVYVDQHGNELLKDLKRALKYSIDYQ